MFGWPVVRRRRYTLLIHKRKATGMDKFPMSLEKFVDLFRQPAVFSHMKATPSWNNFFVATLAELKMDLKWAIGRPESLWARNASVKVKDTELVDEDPNGVFWSALTKNEQSFLNTYSCPS